MRQRYSHFCVARSRTLLVVGVTSDPDRWFADIRRRHGYQSPMAFSTDTAMQLIVEVHYRLRSGGWNPPQGLCNHFDISALPVVLDVVDSWPSTQAGPQPAR
jgi:hypothetical protein